MKRDVPSELREHPPQHITSKLRKQDIDEILEKDKAAKASPNPEDTLLVDDDAAALLLSDNEEEKKKKKKESGIRAARGTEHEEVLNRFERREINDTLPAPPNDDNN